MATQDRTLSGSEHDYFATRSGLPGNAPLTQHKAKVFSDAGCGGVGKPLSQMEREWLQKQASSSKINEGDLWREAVAKVGGTPSRSTSENKFLFYNRPTVALQDYIKSLSGLVAYYPLDETSGNAINQAPDTLGTMDGSVSGATYNQAGQSGGSYFFDASDKITITSGAPANGLTNMTVGGIINITGNGGGGFGRVIAKGNSAVGYWDVNTQGGNLLQFNANFGTQVLNARVTVTFGQWIAFLFSYTGGTAVSTSVVAYLNGSSQTLTFAQDGIGSRSTDDTTFAIANRNTDTSRTFNGSGQHFFVLNRLATAQEALTIAQAAGLA